MASEPEMLGIPRQLILMKKKEDRNRRLVIATVVIIVGVSLTIWGAMMIDQYFDGYDQYQVDELPDLTIGILLSIFGAIMTTIAAIFMLFAVRS